MGVLRVHQNVPEFKIELLCAQVYLRSAGSVCCLITVFHLLGICAFSLCMVVSTSACLSHFVRHSCIVRRLHPDMHGDALLRVFAFFCQAAHVVVRSMYVRGTPLI